MLTPAQNLGGWFHDLPRFVIQFTPEFGIRWYGLAYVFGFLCAYLLLRMLSKRNATKIPLEATGDAIMYLVLGVILGGRLGYVFLYQPALLITFTSDAPWWGVLAINNGGMSSHGGILGVMLACWFVSRGFKDGKGGRIGRCSPMHVMDMASLIGPIGLFFGRVANFVNGELLGKVIARPGQPAPWYAVRYPQEILDLNADQHTQSPEQMSAIIELSMQHMLPGEEYWESGFARVVELIQKGDTGLKVQLEPLIAARYPTQLMQAGFDGLLVLVVCWIVAIKPRRPGVIGAWFLIVYGLGRIPMDLVRLPDADVSQFGMVTRGQLYSALMVIGGIVMLTLISRAKREPIGGWLKPALNE